ncbi:hypothetical protein [Phaffia rhodozyma]|uniref:Uncharacterized protein n=1 Tax=Phaffia rhodozyma TaxID=264483 RepID=A0A0F7SM80_PHARH|nr:hypothetical protein [Phaffia rhodozyma]
MSMIFRTVKSIRSPSILPAKSPFSLVNAAGPHSIRSSRYIRRIHRFEQTSGSVSTTGHEDHNTQGVDTKGGQDRPQVMAGQAELGLQEAAGSKTIKNEFQKAKDKDLCTQRAEGEGSSEWENEAEEDDEIEYNDQVITYIHRLPLELDSITFRDFFWSRGVHVVEAWKATGKRSGIIQTSISDQDLVCDTMDGTQAPWGLLIAKPGDTASTMIKLSEADEHAFQKASSQNPDSSYTIDKNVTSNPKAESLDDMTDVASEASVKISSDNQSDELRQELYLQRIPNMKTLQIDIDPKAEVTLNETAVIEALTSRGYKVPAYHIKDNRILFDVGDLSAEGFREILAKSHPTIKANVLEVVAFSWRSSFFSESALYEVNSRTSLLITSLSPTTSGKLVLRYLLELAPQLKLSSIRWIEKRVRETWAIVTVSGQQAFESVLNVHQQPIGGVPVDVRAMPIETKGSIKGPTKSAWDIFRIHNFPFNLTDDQVRNLFSGGEKSPAVEFIGRINPRAATFKLLNPSVEARRDLMSMQMSVIHGRALQLEIVTPQDLEKPKHYTNSIAGSQISRSSKRTDGPDAGPRLLQRFRKNNYKDAAPVMGNDELIRTMRVFSLSCYIILRNAMEIIRLGQELKGLQFAFVRAKREEGLQEGPNPEIVPNFLKRICASPTNLEPWRSLRYEVFTAQKMNHQQQLRSQQIAENEVRQKIEQGLREIMYHPTHGIHALRPFDFKSLPQPPYRFPLSKMFQRIVLQDPSVLVSMNDLTPNPLSQVDQKSELQQAPHDVHRVRTSDPLSNTERMLLRGRMRAFSPFFFDIFESYRKRSELSIFLQRLQQAYSQLEDKKGGDSEIIPKFHYRLWSILGDLGSLVSLRTEVCQHIEKQKLDIASVDILRIAQIQAAKSYYEGLKEVIYHPTHGLDAKFSLNYRHPVEPPYQNELACRFQRDMTLAKICEKSTAVLPRRMTVVKYGLKKPSQTERPSAVISP